MGSGGAAGLTAAAPVARMNFDCAGCFFKKL